MIAVEWQEMAKGARMQKQRRMKTEVDPYDRLWKSVNAMQAGTNHTETVFGQELQQLTNLATYRRQRLLVSDTGLPGILWCVLILGGVGDGRHYRPIRDGRICAARLESLSSGSPHRAGTLCDL